MTMNALEIKNFCDRSGQAVRTCLTVAVVTAGLALVSASGAFAQDAAAPAADQSAAPAAAPAPDAAAPAPDAAAPAVDQAAAPAADQAVPPPAPADQAAAPAANAEGKAVVENPYGLEALWSQGDIVSRGTLIILVIMSMGTWYILFTRLWDQQKLMGQAKTARAKFWSAGSLKEGMAKLEKDSAYRSMVEDGLKASEHHEGKMTDRIDLNEWVTMSLQRSYESINAEMQAGLAFLASVGSVAPFVGLFGTVWGIYHALIAIGIAGQASIDKVAGPVGEALIMTAIGLAVAVPAVLAYNWLLRRNKVALEDVRNFSADIHAVLVAGARVVS
jgi:biopolymer transport protein ExbB